jgi:hypothetical protein
MLGITTLCNEKINKKHADGSAVRAKKNTMVNNTIYSQNSRDVKDTVKNQHISFSGEGTCFTSIKFHMVGCIPILCRDNICLHGKVAIEVIG